MKEHFASDLEIMADALDDILAEAERDEALSEAPREPDWTDEELDFFASQSED